MKNPHPLTPWPPLAVVASAIWWAVAPMVLARNGSEAVAWVLLALFPVSVALFVWGLIRAGEEHITRQVWEDWHRGDRPPGEDK